jgi:hypothetical protein
MVGFLDMLDCCSDRFRSKLPSLPPDTAVVVHRNCRQASANLSRLQSGQPAHMTAGSGHFHHHKTGSGSNIAHKTRLTWPR